MSRRSTVLALVAAATVAVACACAALVGYRIVVGNDCAASDTFCYIGPTEKGTLIPVADRRPAGAVSSELIAGGAFRLADLRGQVVALNFWGSWCPPCRNEAPGLDAVYRALSADGATIVGLTVQDLRADAEKFVRDASLSYPIVFDPNAKTAIQLGNVPMRGLPATVLVDRRGRVAAVYVGPVTARDVQPPMEALLAED